MQTLVVIALVIYFIYRQTLPRRVRRLGFFIIPIIIIIKAYTSIPPSLGTSAHVELLVTALFSFGIGAWQASFTRVFKQGGDIYTKSGVYYIISWVCLIAGRILIKIIFDGNISSLFSEEWLIWSGVAITMGTRNGLLFLHYPEIRSALNQGRRIR